MWHSLWWSKIQDLEKQQTNKNHQPTNQPTNQLPSAPPHLARKKKKKERKKEVQNKEVHLTLDSFWWHNGELGGTQLQNNMIDACVMASG